MLYPAVSRTPTALARFDAANSYSLFDIESLRSQYPLSNANTLAIVDRSSRVWDAVSNLQYDPTSPLWNLRGAGATSYSTNCTNAHRTPICTVALAIHTSSTWSTGVSSALWPYAAGNVALDNKQLVQNYGALIKPYCADPQRPLQINYSDAVSGSSTMAITEALCFAISPSAFGDSMYVSQAQPVVRLKAHKSATYSDALFAATNGTIICDKRTAVQTVFDNLQPVLAQEHELYALRLTSSHSLSPVCGLIDCTTGLVFVCPVVQYQSQLFSISDLFATTNVISVPQRTSQIGTTFFNVTASSTFTSFNQAMLSGSEHKIADALRQDVQFLTVTSSVKRSSIDYELTFPQGYLTTQNVTDGELNSHVSIMTSSALVPSVAWLSSSVRAACSHIGLFDNDGIMVGYASFNSPQTFLYSSSAASAALATLSSSNSRSVIARLYLARG
jgi:hypothetical protein